MKYTGCKLCTAFILLIVLFMGKGGYCEGKVGDKHGWFPYNVVLEEQKANKGF